jgi:hypothetical protein
MELGRMQRQAFASSFVEIAVEQGLAGQIVFGPLGIQKILNSLSTP